MTELVESVLQEEQLERIQGGSTLQGDQPVHSPGVLGVGGLSADQDSALQDQEQESPVNPDLHQSGKKMT